MVIHILLLSGFLLASIAVVQAASLRWSISESVLPPLLFQAALSVNVREMLGDAAPILLLAVVAVFVATGVVGGALRLTGLGPLADGLLLGAMIATTDPSAVLAVFREVGAPERLVRLVEGESLLNDAAAIAIASVLIAASTGDAANVSAGAALRSLGIALGGGLAVGALAGRVFAWLFPWLGCRIRSICSPTRCCTSRVWWPWSPPGSSSPGLDARASRR